MKIGTVVAAGSDTFPLDYIPQFVGVKVAALTDLESVVVTASGQNGVIARLNAQSIKEIMQACAYGVVQDTDVLFFPCADGVIYGEDVNIFVQSTSGATGGVDVYATWTRKSETGLVIKSYIEDVVANTEKTFDKFMRMGIISPTSTDVITYNGRNGNVSNRMFIEELQALAMLSFDNYDGNYVIENLNQEVSNIVYSPTVQTVVWTQRYSVNGQTNSFQIREGVKQNLSREKAVKNIINREAKQVSRAINTRG